VQEEMKTDKLTGNQKNPYHIITMQMTLSKSYKISIMDKNNSILKKKIVKGKHNPQVTLRMTPTITNMATPLFLLKMKMRQKRTGKLKITINLVLKLWRTP
jgi:hypothetical protein